MKKFQYKSYSENDLLLLAPDDGEDVTALNTLGQQGWELVAISHEGFFGNTYYMKKEYEDND